MKAYFPIIFKLSGDLTALKASHRANKIVHCIVKLFLRKASSSNGCDKQFLLHPNHRFLLQFSNVFHDGQWLSDSHPGTGKHYRDFHILNCLNCPASARIISSFDFKHRTAYNISFIYIPFTGKHEPNELTCSPLCDFIAQLVRALHRHRRGHGFESR